MKIYTLINIQIHRFLNLKYIQESLRKIGSNEPASKESKPDPKHTRTRKILSQPDRNRASTLKITANTTRSKPCWVRVKSKCKTVVRKHGLL